MKKPYDIGIGILVTIMWGCNFSVIELGLQSLDPFILTFLRFLLCCFPFIFFMEKPKNVSLLSIALYGILFGAGLWWVVNFAMYKGLTPGLSSVFLQFSAFFTIIISVIFIKEKINFVHFIGMLLSCLGLSIIIIFSSEESTSVGIFLVLLAALSWAFCNLIVKITKPQNMVAFIVWSSLFSFPTIFIMTLCVKGISPFLQIFTNLNISATFSVVFQAYITTILGYWIWNNLMKKYPAATIAPLSLIVPISGMLCSYIFFGEKLTYIELIAISIIILGIAIFINSNKLKNLLLEN
ncbi:EamA family transporter [Allofrancisella guangzhouensis]|uniref:EamA domain-containing protein n=1 Tax=Allofrancisella guangzhouensis TaxID=594679 RepID=A0A0A8E203_9GAMM|nr:EamA family transporter [Allofrancisella guangzhouensis]AJC48240.1 hypothetical protein SD28_00455 [Allofrancisella guangzhouensis]MBK2027533.1 EamA family transporter [Allofrancisella guangzhouensis]MBK2043768.1 EamA family transporter [Allofrancisella guangzhouensis]MBK2045270.1 EamA family transporter [Allofrancisella guangzhouensis]